MLPGILAMAICSEALMAQVGNDAGVGSAPPPANPVTTGSSDITDESDNTTNGNGDPTVTFTPLPPVETDPNGGGAQQQDNPNGGNTTDATEFNGTVDNNGDPSTPPETGGNPNYSDDPQDTTENNSDNTPNGDDSLLTPAPQPQVDSDNDSSVNTLTTQITELPYTITHAGRYSVLPKAVYRYLLVKDDLPAALPAMIILDPYQDAISSSGSAASITVDFNGTVIPECAGTCSELTLFMTPGKSYPETSSENITIKNLTVNRADTEIYNPLYRVVHGKTQYLTLVNVNREGTDQEVEKSDAVYQTAIFNSTIVEKGAHPSIDQYRGCLTASDSRFENKQIVISDITSEEKCAFHRLVRTMVIESILYDKLDRPLQITNGYVDNSEFNSVILDMNTSHDFHIGTGNLPTPIDVNESVCNVQCGIIDENGDLHWGFDGNEALWQANKRIE
jgi:hypothetical protein